MRLSVRLLIHASVDLSIHRSIPPSLTTLWKSVANIEWTPFEVYLTIIKCKKITSLKEKIEKKNAQNRRIDVRMAELLPAENVESKRFFFAFVLVFFSNYVDVKGRDA